MAAGEDDFDWSGADVVVPRQEPVAVYSNQDGNLVIRKERAWNEEEDTFIVIDRRYARNVLDAMERVLAEISLDANNGPTRISL